MKNDIIKKINLFFLRFSPWFFGFRVGTKRKNLYFQELSWIWTTGFVRIHGWPCWQFFGRWGSQTFESFRRLITYSRKNLPGNEVEDWVRYDLQVWVQQSKESHLAVILWKRCDLNGEVMHSHSYTLGFLWDLYLMFLQEFLILWRRINHLIFSI